MSFWSEHRNQIVVGVVVGIVVGLPSWIISLAAVPPEIASENLRSLWDITGGPAYLALTSPFAIRIYLALASLILVAPLIYIAAFGYAGVRTLVPAVAKLKVQVERIEQAIDAEKLGDVSGLPAKMTVIEQQLYSLENMIPRTQELLGAITDVEKQNRNLNQKIAELQADRERIEKLWALVRHRILSEGQDLIVQANELRSDAIQTPEGVPPGLSPSVRFWLEKAGRWYRSTEVGAATWQAVARSIYMGPASLPDREVADRGVIEQTRNLIQQRLDNLRREWG
ncbi:hypothetical protein [Amorphus sp. MBR-141]